MEKELHPERYYIRNLLNKMLLKEIMIQPVISVHVDELFDHVEEKMRTRGIRHLPVIDEHGVLVGLMTQRDLYRIISPHKNMEGIWSYDKDMLDSIILGQVMIANPLTLTPEDTVATAILEMARTKYGCIIIVDKNKKLCGIVTQIDFIKRAAAILKGELT